MRACAPNHSLLFSIVSSMEWIKIRVWLCSGVWYLYLICNSTAVLTFYIKALLLLIKLCKQRLFLSQYIKIYSQNFFILKFPYIFAEQKKILTLKHYKNEKRQINIREVQSYKV